MLRNMEELRNFTLGATDGEIGKVKDFYFDDQTWKLRYLVVETGNWLFGRKVLISPAALHALNWDNRVFPTNLSKEQIKNSPNINTDKPVSKQDESSLHSFYSWPHDLGGGMGYMTTGMVGGVVAPGVPFEESINNEMEHHYDKHLRSFKQVKEYSVMTDEGEIGEVDDFLMEDNNWVITSMVVLAGNWYQGERIMIPVGEVKNIEDENNSVYIKQTTMDIKRNPEYTYKNPSGMNG